MNRKTVVLVEGMPRRGWLGIGRAGISGQYPNGVSFLPQTPCQLQRQDFRPGAVFGEELMDTSRTFMLPLAEPEFPERDFLFLRNS